MSYDPVSQTALNMSRRALGDTSNDAALELLSDAEITALISANGYNLGVALMAEGLSVRFAQEPGSVTLPSGLSVSWSQRVQEWRLIASQYRALSGGESALDTLALTSSAHVKHRIVW
jgi:hypothetical protein